MCNDEGRDEAEEALAGGGARENPLRLAKSEPVEVLELTLRGGAAGMALTIVVTDDVD